MNRPISATEVGPGNLFDRQGVAEMKRLSRGDSPEAMAAVAQQFEALFVGMMLKSMREASSSEGGLFSSPTQQTYQGMFDQQIALQTADRGILGISGLMLQQLQHQSGAQMTPETVVESSISTGPRRAEVVSRATEDVESIANGGQIQADIGVSLNRSAPAAIPARVEAVKTEIGRAEQRQPVVDNRTTETVEKPRRQLTADEFVEQIWPLAVTAAERLGVAPEAIAGQAILESGWGQKTIRHGDMRSSHNIFGIKAGPDWQGESVTVTTLEYKNGVAERQQAAFRSYDSHQEAFADYADFLQQRSWYQPALEQGRNVVGFAQGLQQAGYATDPQYANKIIRLAEQVKHQYPHGVPG
ncbi:MAG: flagellar assembly peptidoglycan hydrolase FlgJ [Gammaproteobacteria bacterium]